MSIVMTYSKLGSQNFARSFNKVTNAQLPIKAAYLVKKMTDKLEVARKQIRDEYQKDFVEVYGERDEKGNVITAPGNEGFKVKEDQQEAFSKAEKEFDARTFTLDRPRLDVMVLAQASLTATDLVALEDVLDTSALEVEADETKVAALKSVK